MHAADAFVPLAVWLRGPAVDGTCDAEAPAADPPPPAIASHAPPVAVPADLVEAARDVRLFRARLADALDAATGALVRELAYAVLGRELLLAPADVAALAARILAEHPAATPLAVHHAPGETLAAPVTTVADASLAPGDLLLVFREGTVDARLGVRLDVAREAWS